MRNNALYFIAFAICCSLVSFLLDRKKTIQGFKKGLKMFRNILVPFLNILIIISFVLVVIPPQWIVQYLGAGIKNIFIYLGAFSSLKIPMLGIEIGYLGFRFTLVRTLIALPLCIGLGYFMEWYLKDKNFEVHEMR